jgi:hypothetical protein
MKRSEQDQLLKEILAGDDLSDFRRASLEQGLVAIRRQRRRRRVVRACALVSLPFLLVLGIVIRRTLESPAERIASVNPPVTAIPAPRAGSGDVKFITDEELFALFPNRLLALIGKPGQQQLVFLDKGISQGENR